MEDMRCSRHHLRCHAAERNRQIVKALQVVIREHSAVQQHPDACAGIQPARQSKAVFEAKFEPVRVRYAIFFASKTQRIEWSLSAQYCRPVDTCHKTGD